MDLGIKIMIAVVVVSLAVIAWRVIAGAAKRAARRRRAAAAHGLGDEQRRHAYADRLATAQMRDSHGDNSGWFRHGPLPWQEPGSQP